MVYHAIGLVSAVAALGLVAFAGATLALLALYGRKGRVVWPRVAVLGGRLFHAPLALLLRALGGRTGLLDFFGIESANAAMARRFARAGPVRLLAVPQCLRSGECAARLHPDDGYRCLGCGKCPLAELGRAAAERGFRLFIVPGGGMARRLVGRLGPDAAVGVACASELRMALLAVRSMGVPAVGVPLASGGCFETRVDLGRVREAMRRCGSERLVLAKQEPMR